MCCAAAAESRLADTDVSFEANRLVLAMTFGEAWWCWQEVAVFELGSAAGKASASAGALGSCVEAMCLLAPAAAMAWRMLQK